MQHKNILLIFFFCSVYLPAQWVQNYGPTRSVSSLYSFNNTLFAVSSLNGTNVTTDDGVNWVTKNTSGQNIAKFYWSIGTRLLMYSYSSGINYSDNNGKTWSVATPSNKAININGFYQYGDTLLIYGEWKIYKSINKGVTWTPIYSGLPSSVAVINTVAYNGGKLYVGTLNYGIYMSSDYGATWIRQDGGLNLVAGFYKEANSFVVVGNDLFCASLENGNTTIYKLPSGATNWIPISGTSLNAVQVSAFISDGALFYLGARTGVYISSDFGVTWTKRTNGLTNPVVLSLLKKSNLIIAGCSGDQLTDFGGIYASADTGKTWKQIKQNYEIPKINSFTVLNNTIYFSGIGRTNINDLMKSTDGGINWTPVTRPNLPSIMGIKNINGDLFAWGTNTQVTLGYGFMKSTDGGSTWSAARTGLSSSPIISCLFNFGTKLFAGTQYFSGSSIPMLYASTDKGATWAVSSSGLINGVSVGGITSLNGKLFVTASGVYSSSDTGKTWTKLTTNLPNVSELTSLYQAGPYIFTYVNAKLYKTVDGINWIDASAGMEQNSNATVGSIDLSDSIYYAGTSNSGVYRSTNGGNSWTAINTGFWENYPIASKIIIQNNAIIAGGLYAVYRRPLSELTDVHEYSQINTINGFELRQNYPNPFNPSTVISYSLPKASRVKITVYNLLGQLVAELINTQMSAGNHQVSFNAINYASGIYFYKFETDEFSQIRKMTLLK